MWTERAAKAGGLDAMDNYAAWMANTSDYYRFPLDLVKAYGLTLVLANTELPSRGAATKSILNGLAI